MLMQAAGLCIIALIASPSLSTWQLALPLVLTGCGGSIAMPAVQNAVLSAVPPSDLGKASGTFNMLRFLGGMLVVGGMVVMAWNLWHTAADARARLIQPVPVPVPEPHPHQVPAPLPAMA